VNIHSIDIPGGYSGTVELTTGKMQLEAGGGVGGGYSFTSKIIFYHFSLLTPDRKNIEFYLLRFPDGEWCDTKNMYMPHQRNLNQELCLQAKAEVVRLGL
jgi:hypothetical protein